MSTKGTKKYVEIADDAVMVQEGPKCDHNTDSESDDPTGLRDLENLSLRWDQGEHFSDSNSENGLTEHERVGIADHAYDCLLVVIEDEGHSVGNGIIVLRTIDKIFNSWNSLLHADNFDKDAYKQAALHAVSATDQLEIDSVWHLTARAFVDMFDLAECSVADLTDIKSGVEAMRARISGALEYERTNNGKSNIIKSMTDKLIVIERSFSMRETASNVELSVATIPAKATALTPSRGNRTRTHTVDWTDQHRLELLKIYRDMPNATHKARAEEFSSRSLGVERTGNAIRQEHARLTKKGVTIAQLEATLSRSGGIPTVATAQSEADS